MAFTLNSLLLKSDLYTYEYFLHGDVCRLCWTKNPFKEIASNMIHLNGVKIEVMDVIRQCLDIDLCDDKYPSKVCDHCWEFVKKIYSFKTYCQESDRKLREIIDSGRQGTTLIDGSKHVKAEIKNEIDTDIIDNECLKKVSVKKISLKPKLLKRKNKIKIKKNSENYCYICCTEFDGIEKYNDHNSECHGIKNGWYKCFGCIKQFKTTRSRTSHEKKFCKALVEGYKCSVCGRFLPSRKLYEAHMRYHDGKESDVALELSENIFECRKCDASFKTKDSLKGHMLTHNTVDNHYVCETCGNVFLRHDYLQKHIMIHMGVKRHVCTYCGLRFVQKSSLNVHLRKHTGERPYKCDMCPQRCVSSSNLRAHRRRHLGIKQFECGICSKKFGYKMSLAEHIASAHAPAQKYQCAVCGAVYSRRKGLQRHAAKKHGGGANRDVANDDTGGPAADCSEQIGDHS